MLANLAPGTMHAKKHGPDRLGAPAADAAPSGCGKGSGAGLTILGIIMALYWSAIPQCDS